MRKLILFLLLSIVASAQTIVRPTTEASNTALLCAGSWATSAAMPYFYDASGTSTNSTQSVTALPSNTTGTARGRSFSGFASTPYTGTYTLNVNLAFSNTGASGMGEYYLEYSIDGGATWTVLATSTINVSQQTFSKSFTSSQSTSQLQIGVCVDAEGDGSNGGAVTLTGYDIWLSGTTSVAARKPFRVTSSE
jgi:hypothetical protein